MDTLLFRRALAAMNCLYKMYLKHIELIRYSIFSHTIFQGLYHMEHIIFHSSNLLNTVPFQKELS